MNTATLNTELIAAIRRQVSEVEHLMTKDSGNPHKRFNEAKSELIAKIRALELPGIFAHPE